MTGADERAAHPDTRGAEHEIERRAVERHREALGAHVAAGAERERGHAQIAEQLAAVRVDGIHDRRAPRLRAALERAKEKRLGTEIIIGVAVEIEVIAPEIGEHGDVPRDALDAMLHQRVRRHLHRDVRRAPVAHGGEPREELGRRRRRERRRDDVAAEPIADRADDARAQIGGAPHRLEEVRDGRLAVRAGDADHRQIVGRVAMEMRGDAREEPRRGAGLDPRHAGRRHGFGDDGDGTARARVGDVARAVGARAREGDEEIAFAHGTRVGAHAAHDDRGIAVNGGRHLADVAQELTEPARLRRAGHSASLAGARLKVNAFPGAADAPGGGVWLAT